MAQQMNGKGLISMGVAPSSQSGTQKDQESRKRALPLRPFLPQWMLLLCCLRPRTFGPTTQMALWDCITGFPGPNSWPL